MHIHILGICGTFMGGIALLARQAGHKVTGADRNVYPPMSTELESAGIEIIEGYGAEQLDLNPDLVVVGNVMRRGMPVIERLLNEGRRYVSGPGWLEEHFLQDRRVLAVAGTHGKTTTASMLAWILEYAGLEPGFLIGGVTGNFGISARAGKAPWFVIEADEYDCAFFDKRSKFVHYHPEILILNNLEYDHADIFANLGEIQRQFHHLIRTVPGRGAVILEHDESLEEVLAMGIWSRVIRAATPGVPSAQALNADASLFALGLDGKTLGTFTSPCSGVHNLHNALMAVLAAHEAGVPYTQAAAALAGFEPPKRRLELRGIEDGVSVYDDFAHHPTAVRLTLEGLRARLGPENRLVAVFEPRSNSMRMGANHELLGQSFKEADEVFVFAGDGLEWDVMALPQSCPRPMRVLRDFEALKAQILAASPPGTAILVMSNGSFNGLHGALLELLEARGAGRPTV